MVHVMYFVITLGSFPAHPDQKTLLWGTSIALTPTTKQKIGLLLVWIWIAYEDGKTNIVFYLPTLLLVLYCNSWLVVECEEIKLSLPIWSRVKYPCWSRVKRTRPGCGWASIGCLCFLWLLISCDPMGLPAYGDIVNIVIFRAYCSRDNGAYFVSSRGAKIMLWGLTS